MVTSSKDINSPDEISAAGSDSDDGGNSKDGEGEGGGDFDTQHHEVAEVNVRLEVEIEEMEDHIRKFEQEEGVVLSDDEPETDKTVTIMGKVMAMEKQVSKMKKKNEEILKKIERGQKELHVGKLNGEKVKVMDFLFVEEFHGMVINMT